MRMLVLGAGQQGSACAYDLLTNTDHEVLLADVQVDALPEFLQPHVGGRLQVARVDAGDHARVQEVMRGVAATMNALPYYFNLGMAEAALEAGSHYCDLGGNTEIVLEQKALHRRAQDAGVSIVPDCGLAPGMINILAQLGISSLDRASSVSIMVGGLPQRPDPPLNYQVVYSLEGVLDYYTTRSWVLRDKEPLQVDALSEVEPVEIPGVGKLEAFHTAGGLSTMAQRYQGALDSMEYKTLRYPGHAAAMKMMRELGLFDLKPVEIDGREVVPRDAFLAIVGPRLRKDPSRSPDMVVVRVEVTGERGGRKTTLRWNLVDHYDKASGITAMMRCTGFSLAITGEFQVTGRIPAGVGTPDEVVPAEAFIQALRKRGVDIRFSEA